MTTPNPFTTANPQAFNGNKLLLPNTGGVATNSNLASLFLSSEFRNLPIVSPELPTREDIAKKVPIPGTHHQAAHAANHHATQMSLMVASHVLSDYSRQRKQPHLVPRPVKSGARSLGKPPPIPLIPSGRKTPAENPTTAETSAANTTAAGGGNGAGGNGKLRLNKFVRRLHDMLQAEKNSGIVEWRRGLLVLNSTDAFAKQILPKHFNTRNFKTFRRQLNYYGFVHVRSFSTTGSSTTALWVNRDLAKNGTDDISSVLQLRRVEPCEEAKTAEGRRQRKEMAIHTVEEDIGVSPKTLQLQQIRSLAMRGGGVLGCPATYTSMNFPTQQLPPIPFEVRVPTDSVSPPHFLPASTKPAEVIPIEETPSGAGDAAESSESAANMLLMLARS